MLRNEILDTAKTLTMGDRNKQYGSPLANMDTFTNLVDAYQTNREDWQPYDGAMIALLLKVARVATAPKHSDLSDTFTDMAAYAAIAGECWHLSKPLDNVTH